MRSAVNDVAAIFMLAVACSPAGAQNQNGQPAPAKVERPTRLRGLTQAEASALIKKLQEAQAGLARGEKIYFDLLAGAPAAYDMTTVSPRKAFLDMAFEKPANIERVNTGNPLWKPHRLEYWPMGPGQLVWDVEVVLGFNGNIERVEMFYRPPHPF